MRDFKTLQVWEKAHQLVLAVYRATADFPKEELYGLTSQMRRAAVSIPANIAEGCGRGGDPELAHFLQISMGSASELEYYFRLAYDLNFIDQALAAQLQRDLVEVKRMLNSFIQKVRASR